MRKLSLVIPILAVAAALFLLATSQHAQAAALNETDSPAEADFCIIQYPQSASTNGDIALLVVGRIFEAGITDGPGQGAGISAEVGFGPQGSDPITGEVDWSWSTATYSGDVGNDDEYSGGIFPTSAVSTIDYAFAVRFSTDASTGDYTYCDLDGAGSNPGVDFDFTNLGVLTINGTGGGQGDSEGDVTTSVDVISDPGACIILDTNAVSFGQETFSTQNAAQLGLAQVTVTSCSLTTSLDLLAKGTNAAGPTAAWALADPPGSGNMCDTGGGGIDEYSQRVQTNDSSQGTNVALTNRAYMTGLAQGESQPTDILLRMPCIGSSGTGETVSSTIMFTAIPGAPDADGDGFAPPADCDDGDPAVFPGAPEVLNGIDDNCDGLADEDLLVDDDFDGFTAATGDCNDANAAVHPGATEVLNGIDDDCDGSVDEGLPFDNDGDGFTAATGDCNDANAAVHPGATEIIGDGVDNDCDGAIE